MIGNYVLFDTWICKVDQINPPYINISHEGHERCVHIDKLQPIPITKELLLKNGFEELKQGKDKYHNCIAYVYGDSIHLYNQGDEWKLIIDDEKTWVEWANIKYVHQLQTFCNVLGVDLKLKL